MSSHHARLALRAAVALFAAAVGWFAVNLVHPVGPPVLLWVSVPAIATELLRRADAAMYAAKKIPGTAFLHHSEPAQAA